ncbi:MAG: helix-turn-helix domain-containing protein [Acidimicrobiales bacterium]|nr:helix-turn-helix domain-containing protein [Acidimicrobiales bacterium]
MTEVDVEDRLLWPEEVAEVLGVPIGTLANWRYQGRGPAFVKVGRHVRYRRSDVLGWIERNVVPAGDG